MIKGNISNVFHGKLTGSMGLYAGKASGIVAMLMQMITNLISKNLGGDEKNIPSLLGGGDLAGMAKGMLGNLFKK